MSHRTLSSGIPLSPSSPNEASFKQQRKNPLAPTAPRSPVSPPYMSVATKSYVSSYENNRHTDEMAQRPPRSPGKAYTQPAPRPSSASSDQPNHLKRSMLEEDVERHRDKRQKLETTPDQTDGSNTITPTNHDRLEIVKPEPSIPGLGGLQEVRHEEADNLGEQSEVSLRQGEDRDDAIIASLSCKFTHSRSLPDPSQHLMVTYGLGPLLRTVARTDPSTGEKINKLRKSYEGQIKLFALAGRNKSKEEKRDPDTMIGPLRTLATMPEAEYRVRAEHTNIEVTNDLRAKLQQALQLNPGMMKDNLTKEDILGHEKRPPPTSQQQIPTSAPTRTPNVPRSQQPNVVGEDKRGTRGKKRSYRDNSFVGYGEEYSDNDGVDSDNDHDGDRRKRKKV